MAPRVTETRGADLTCEVSFVHPDAVEAARAAIGEERPVEEVAALFSVLGDPTRLRLLLALTAGPLCTCDLAAVLGVSDSAVSHQLRLLKELNLVQSVRRGKFVYHELAGGSVQSLVHSATAALQEVP